MGEINEWLRVLGFLQQEQLYMCPTCLSSCVEVTWLDRRMRSGEVGHSATPASGI